MGPRPFSRGNFPSETLDDLIAELQWGRDLSVAETASIEVPERSE